jgi:hypothetical protein
MTDRRLDKLKEMVREDIPDGLSYFTTPELAAGPLSAKDLYEMKTKLEQRKIAQFVPVSDRVLTDAGMFRIPAFPMPQADPIVGDGDATDVYVALREWEKESFIPPKVTMGIETLSRIRAEASPSGSGSYSSGSTMIWGAPLTVVEGSGFIVEAA